MTRSRWFDLAVATGLLGLGLGGYLASSAEAGQRSPDALGVLLVLGGTVPLVWRRVEPRAVLAVVVASTLAFWILDYPEHGIGPNVVVALYSTTAWGRGRRESWLAAGTAITASIVVFVAGVLSPEEDLSLATVLGSTAFFVVGAVAGDAVRNRRLYLAELHERAAEAERDREVAAARAVVDERARIARELHDVVAHSVSVMVVQAGAARRMVDVDAETAKEAIEAIEQTGRESLDEMRRVLGVLREGDDAASLAPQPTLDQFDDLLDHYERTGLPVALHVEGEPRGLPVGVSLAAYRIVQEALTNTLKHAGPAEASVVLRYEPDELQIEVVDTGRGAAARVARAEPNGTGHGLVGMRERVELYGGSLHSGPRRGGGYRVRATLPT